MSRSLVLSALITLLIVGGCSRGPSDQPAGGQPPAAQPASNLPGGNPPAGVEPANTPPAAAQRSARQPRPNAPQRSSRVEPATETVTVPADTLLRVRLDTLVASDSSNVEDPDRASVAKPVVVHGLEAVPEGSEVTGVVTEARRSGKVKGRAKVAFRFDQIVVAGRQQRVHTRTVAMEAPATKRNDALKIGAPAAGGAVLGALLGGKKGAAIGAGVGGGAGTAVVLATRGKEVRLTPGTVLTVKLLEPVTVSVPADR